MKKKTYTSREIYDLNIKEYIYRGKIQIKKQ